MCKSINRSPRKVNKFCTQCFGLFRIHFMWPIYMYPWDLMLLLNTVTWSICRRTSRSAMNVKTNFAICNLSTWKRAKERLQKADLRVLPGTFGGSFGKSETSSGPLQRTYHDAEAYSIYLHIYYDANTNEHPCATHTLSVCNMEIDNVDNGYFTSTSPFRIWSNWRSLRRRTYDRVYLDLCSKIVYY